MNDKLRSFFAARNAINKQREELTSLLEDKQRLESALTALFGVRWNLS